MDYFTHRKALLVQVYLFALVVCLPLYIIRFHIKSYPTTLLEVLLFGFFVLTLIYHWSLLTFVMKNMRQPYSRLLLTKMAKDTLRKNWIFIGLVTIFVLSSILGVKEAIDLRSALGIFRAYIIEPIIFFLLLLTYRSKLNIVTPILLGSGALAAWLFGLSAIQILAHHWVFAPDELRLNRATGVFTTANALGLLLGPFGALQTAFAMGEPNKKLRLMYLLSAVLTAGTIILSQSLTALGALIVSMFFTAMLFLFFRTNHATKWLVGVAAVGFIASIVGSLLFFYFVLPKIAPTVYGPGLPSDSLTIRYYMWRGTIAMLNHHIMGVGFSSFPKAVGPYRIYQSDSLRRGFAVMPLYPHHMLLNFWSEIGIGGALSFFGICYYIVQAMIKQRASTLALGVLGAFVYILIHGFTDVPYFKNDLAMAFWLFVALGFFAMAQIHLLTD